ncbi:MAG: hypothetical protein II202_03780 [Bacteroidales bacterium]|nr:hypothetical protein [Bacteroidales bacterium]
MRTGYIVLLIALLHQLGAQNLWCQEDYLVKMERDAVIYRGPVALKYPFLYEGSTYVFSDEFLEGNVRYNGKTYYRALLNLDAHRDELCIRLPESGVVVVLSKELVKEFSLGEKRFIKCMWEDEDLKDTYCQVLYSGNVTVLKKVEKDFYLRDGISQVVYEKVKYYLVKDGVPYLIRKKRDLSKLYREDKKRLNSAMDSLEDSVADKDEFYARVGAFIDNI